MIQLDENYQEFLKGTSVRYEMYVKEMATGSRTDINNYKSVHQFSESNTISIGFFGMGTCEFEIEKNTLTEGAFIQIIASTPDYPRISRPAGEAPLFGGIGTDSPFYELYAAAKDKAKELGVIPVFSDNITYELINSNSLKLICSDMQVAPTVYWEDIYHAGTFYHRALRVRWEELPGSYITTITVQKLNGQISINTLREKHPENTDYIATQIIQNPDESYLSGRSVNMYTNFYFEDIYIDTSDNPYEEFPVFTGFVKKIEKQQGLFKIYCNDSSDILDMPLSQEEMSKIGGQPRSYNYVLNALMNEYISAWISYEAEYPELFDNVIRFYVKPAATRRQIIADICSQVGANAFINYNGELVIKWYDKHYNPEETDYMRKYEINEDSIYDNGFVVGPYTGIFVFNTINFINQYVESENPTTISFTNDYSRKINSITNIYFKTMLYGFGKEYCKKIFDKLKNTYGENGQVRMVGNFTYELGDAVVVTILDEGEFRSGYFLISQIQHECDGGLITQINSYAYPENTNVALDANSPEASGSQTGQGGADISALQTQVAELSSKAVQSITLNGEELKSGIKAMIPIASDVSDGAITKELYKEWDSEIEPEQIDQWFGQPIATGVGIDILGNYVKPVYSEILLTNAIIGGESDAADI